MTPQKSIIDAVEAVVADAWQLIKTMTMTMTMTFTQ
jgi:hypothetical protein